MKEIINYRENWWIVALFLPVLVLTIWMLGVTNLFIMGSICIALLFLISVISKSNTIALLLILTPAFSQGIFSLMGIPTIVPRMCMELTILLLLGKSLYLQGIIKKAPIRAFGFLPMLGLFVVSLFSVYINEEPIFPFLLFCRHIFIFYLLLVALLNLNISESTIKKINKYIVLLFLIQIPAAITKFVIIGQDEGAGVGTVSMQGGELSTILPLVAIAFLFAFCLFKSKKKYIVFIIGFMIFGLIGEKRALMFYIPLLLFLVYYLYTKQRRAKRIFSIRKAQMKYIFLILVISFLGLYSASKLIVTLNAENEIGGSFDPKFLANKVITYNTWVLDNGKVFGRYAATIYTYRCLEKGGPINLLLGLGTGNMVESSLIKGRQRVAFNRFGIRAGLTGFVWFAFQVGLLGTIFLCYLYLKLFKKVYMIYRGSSDPYFKSVALGFLGATFVLFLDFFTYSKTSMSSGVLTPVYFYIAAIILRHYYICRSTTNIL